MQEGMIELTGFRYKKVKTSALSYRASDLIELGTDMNCRIQSRLHHDKGRHGSSRGLAVCSRDIDNVIIAVGDESQELSPVKDSYIAGHTFCNLRIMREDRCRLNGIVRLKLGNVLSYLAVIDLNAVFGQRFRSLGRRHIGACNIEAVTCGKSCESAHRDTAYPDKIYFRVLLQRIDTLIPMIVPPLFCHYVIIAVFYFKQTSTAPKRSGNFAEYIGHYTYSIIYSGYSCTLSPLP